MKRRGGVNGPGCEYAPELTFVLEQRRRVVQAKRQLQELGVDLDAEIVPARVREAAQRAVHEFDLSVAEVDGALVDQV